MARTTLRGNIVLLLSTAAAADATGMTLAEATAATDITGVPEGETAMAMSGWERTSSNIPTPDLLSLTTSSIPGEVTLGEANIQYYVDTEAMPINDLLEAMRETKQSGFLTIVKKKTLTVGTRYETFPIQVTDVADDLNAGNVAATWTASFSLGQPIVGTLGA